jgi:DNA repair photolyase
MKEKLELFSPGALGTCWYGKYHYMEPWAGCGHACPYCYAKVRTAVKGSLSELGTRFDSPAPLFPEEELLRRIKTATAAGDIKILKLCRYTDILSPEFVNSGLAYKILLALADSPVQRMIITTKGLPDAKIIDLLKARKEKFSYNAAARPVTPMSMDKHLAPAALRLAAAAEIAKGGVATTIHMDPFVAGYDDETGPLEEFLCGLKKLGLNRIMFSYLLLSEDIIAQMTAELGKELMDKIAADYDMTVAKNPTPGETDTYASSLLPELKRRSVEKTAAALDKLGFDYVLCSLKSTPGLDLSKLRRGTLCDGKFYA